jgi:paraquat-inducible protein B
MATMAEKAEVLAQVMNHIGGALVRQFGEGYSHKRNLIYQGEEVVAVILSEVSKDSDEFPVVVECRKDGLRHKADRAYFLDADLAINEMRMDDKPVSVRFDAVKA